MKSKNFRVLNNQRMMRKTAIGAIVLILICWNYCDSSIEKDNSQAYSYSLRQVFGKNSYKEHYQWFSIDFLGDGNDHIVAITTSKTDASVTGEGLTHFITVDKIFKNCFVNLIQKDAKRAISNPVEVDLDGNDSLDLAFSYSSKDEHVIVGYTYPFNTVTKKDSIKPNSTEEDSIKPVFTFHLRKSDFIMKKPDQEWGASVRIVGTIRNSKLNRNLVIICAVTGVQCNPRAIYAYDYGDNKIRWTYEHGGHIHDCTITDIDSDGNQEIVACTGAPNNRCEKNGVADTICTVFCLSGEGNEVFKEELDVGSKKAYLKVSDFNLDGQQELVVTYEVQRPDKPVPLECGLIILNTKGKRLAQEKFEDLLCSRFEVCDVNNDNEPEIILGFLNRSVRYFRFHAERNTFIEILKEDINVRNIEGVYDITNDGKPEFILSLMSNQFGIYNNELKTIVKYSASEPRFNQFSTDSGRNNYLMINTLEGEPGCYEIISSGMFEGLLTREWTIRLIIFSGVAGVLGMISSIITLSFAFLRRKVKGRKSNHLMRTAVYREWLKRTYIRVNLCSQRLCCWLKSRLKDYS